MLALAVCTLIAFPFAAAFFWMGATWARHAEDQLVLALPFPPRHPSHQPSNLRLVECALHPFDWQDEPA